VGAVPTAERILESARELFAERGFDGVTVREIVKPLGLTEATVYVHFESKAALLEAIFERLETDLITPGFTPPPVEAFTGPEPFDLTEHLMSGAKRFFGRADRATQLTWRLLMVSQYRFESARHAVARNILNAPVGFFTTLLERMKEAGRIREEVDVGSVAKVIASIFFEHSFRQNLAAAWEGDDSESLEDLRGRLDVVAAAVVQWA
jgi:AcrR family transcriptional regulator